MPDAYNCISAVKAQLRKPIGNSFCTNRLGYTFANALSTACTVRYSEHCQTDDCNLGPKRHTVFTKTVTDAKVGRSYNYSINTAKLIFGYCILLILLYSHSELKAQLSIYTCSDGSR